MEVEMPNPYVLEVRIGLTCDGQVLAVLRREFEARTRVGTVELTWRVVDCAADQGAINVVCEARASDLGAAKDAAVIAAASAARALAPTGEPTVRVRGVGIVVPPRPAVLSTAERWGWYSVTVVIRAAVLQADPSIGEYLKVELPKMMRFRGSSIDWLSGSATARMTVLTLARSPNAAFGEAADAVERLMVAAVKRPDYSVEPDRVEWVAPE